MKHHRPRLLFLLAVLCLAVCLLAGCAARAATADPDADLPTIVIGSDSYPPFNYLSADGQPTGIDVELATEAFRRMGYKAQFVTIDWVDKKELVENGTVDCLWGSFSIDGREDEYRWAGPYMVSRQVVAVMPGSDIETWPTWRARPSPCRPPPSRKRCFWMAAIPASPRSAPCSRCRNAS